MTDKTQPCAECAPASMPAIHAEQIFEVAAPYFAWNASSWHKATQGTIGMPQLLEFTKAAIMADRRATAPHAAQPVGGALVAKAEPSQITNTLDARKFVDDWHRKHFPTDRTFSRYIKGDTERNQLAGDFAWQLAKALEAMGAAESAAAPAELHHNFTTHRASWREAIQAAIANERDSDRRAYWEHELRAYDEAFGSLATQPTTQAEGK